MPRLQVRMTDELAQMLDKIAKKRGCTTRSDAVRQCIADAHNAIAQRRDEPPEWIERMQRLADELGCMPERLVSEFERDVGVPPKQEKQAFGRTRPTTTTPKATRPKPGQGQATRPTTTTPKATRPKPGQATRPTMTGPKLVIARPTTAPVSKPKSKMEAIRERMAELMG